MSRLLERIENLSMNKRTFLGLAATVGVTTALGLTGCSNKTDETFMFVNAPTSDSLSGGEWKTFRCMKDGCTNACVNQAYTVDGIILRQRTDETHPDSIDNPQYRSCVKGRSWGKEVTAPDRLKYPMRRKNWRPGGGANVNGHLRGIDEWERISWETAISNIAEEFTRVKNTYGNKAFLGLGQAERKLHQGMNGGKIFNLMGGCLTTFGQMTSGGTAVVSSFIGNGGGSALDRMALRHTKMLVLFGNNTAWIQPNQMYNTLIAKKAAGMKIVMIDPWFNNTAQALADQWIPIHPGTDGALIEALAYELIRNDWQDQTFLDKCCVGFDKTHPNAFGPLEQENYRDYINGLYDGQPKTPEWASRITGVPVATIEQLARDMHDLKPLNIRSSTAAARSYYGNRLSHQVAALAWMNGCMGVLGAGYNYSGHGMYAGSEVSRGESNFGPYLPDNPIGTRAGANGRLTSRTTPFDNTIEYGIPYAEVFKAVATGSSTYPGPEHRQVPRDIKVIYGETARNYANQNTGSDWVREGYRAVEFVLNQDMCLKGGPVFSDILLPVKSHLEMELIYPNEGSAGLVTVGSNVINPYYECKDDVEIYFLLCEALGFGEDVAPRRGVKQTAFERVANTTVARREGSGRDNLVSITQKDLDYFGINNAPQDLIQDGLIPVRTFLEDYKGIYQVTRIPGDNLQTIPQKAFVDDPDNNPLTNSQTGKLEFYCQSLKNHYDTCMYHDIDALPKYKAMVDGYEQMMDAIKAGGPDAAYKYQMLTLKHLRCVGTVGVTNKTLNEVFSGDCLINNSDAQKDGIQSGDWVLVTGFNTKDSRQLARRARAVPYVAPGTVIVFASSWLTVDEETGIDIGGCPNYITRVQLLGDGYQAYNTVLVKVEKYTGPLNLLTENQKPYLVPVATDAPVIN